MSLIQKYLFFTKDMNTKDTFLYMFDSYKRHFLFNPYNFVFNMLFIMLPLALVVVGKSVFEWNELFIASGVLGLFSWVMVHMIAGKYYDEYDSKKNSFNFTFFDLIVVLLTVTGSPVIILYLLSEKIAQNIRRIYVGLLKTELF